ncbi:DUF6794 domain-containing protein [Tahibacter harae]|uniref:DUF6794 domain-containing protein n=1 Tax=Tahibacter harae TaxID=2963937 RepID=A0ABT1QPW6_9GAMM|nr:DUF6794 domain-containing protein [Tahibacter harae]MCQ4164330.1 hypothetical protein [Tahibacter harae]
MLRKKAFGLVLFLASAVLLLCIPYFSGKTCRVNPDMFCRPFERIEGSLDPGELHRIKKTSPSESVKLHDSFGMAIRNTLDLWSDNDMTRYFRAKGIAHPDMMSDAVVRGFIAYANGGDVDMDEISRAAADRQIPPPPPGPEEESKRH